MITPEKLQAEPEELPGNFNEDKGFAYRTTKLAGIKFFGRESLLQTKKRIGGEGTKVPHHRRIMTDCKALAKFVENRAKQTPVAKPKLEKRLSGDQRVQIIETLDDPDALDDNKSCPIPPKAEKIADKIDQQMIQAEQLIAKVTQDRIDIDDIDLEEGDNEESLSGEGRSEADEDEKEIDVTVGEVLKDIAVLITSEYHLFAWPLDMLPRDIKKGAKLSFLIKRNSNSEVLRKNAICTQQSDIKRQLQMSD